MFVLANILLTIFYKIFQFSGRLLIYNKKETAPEFTDAVSFLKFGMRSVSYAGIISRRFC